VDQDVQWLFPDRHQHFQYSDTGLCTKLLLLQQMNLKFVFQWN